MLKPLKNLILCTSAVLCAYSLLPCHVSAAGSAAKLKTVKVGVLNNTTYADQDENGVWRGIDVECLISIAQKAGFQLEFIDSTNDPDFMGSLDNGNYDIVADVVKTPERAEKYLFTDEVLVEHKQNNYTNSFCCAILNSFQSKRRNSGWQMQKPYNFPKRNSVGLKR